TAAFKPARNPWDPARPPGGASGGSAAAGAAGMAPWALGSDTGGSIRQPAALCGVVGMKPTYGRVSRYGLIPFASSLDQIGPLTRDVADCALALAAISGRDPLDSTSVDVPVPDYSKALRAEPAGLTIGLPKEYFGPAIDREVREAVERAAQLLAEHGAKVREISLPHSRYALQTYYLIAPAEASSNLARYDGVRYGLRVEAPDVPRMMERTRSHGFGPEVKRRIMLGTYVLSAGYYDAYYLKALKVRTLIRRDFEAAFSEVDVLLAPTAPTTAFRLGERIDNPMLMYATDILTIPANLAGLPALSMPCGVDSQGLPIGMQIMGPPFGEEAVLQAAYTYEQLAWPTGAGRHWRAGREVAAGAR
ncbi:MAG: Asp-tRNA(Asn)/Glu-tRNA(Gln) amidotransferase subunit GatA, partial [Firmicutes bacterium]|nr:Asp-tRNA(Asn)/Glu-tRNA(Gln) amidotransferase subunit GatA [Bacillota bacterium]